MPVGTGGIGFCQQANVQATMPKRILTLHTATLQTSERVGATLSQIWGTGTSRGRKRVMGLEPTTTTLATWYSTN